MAHLASVRQFSDSNVLDSLFDVLLFRGVDGAVLSSVDYEDGEGGGNEGELGADVVFCDLVRGGLEAFKSEGRDDDERLGVA